jgi:hypothetical protein
MHKLIPNSEMDPGNLPANTMSAFQTFARHTHSSRFDAVRTSIGAVQQKLMRHAHICTTMNVYGDVVMEEMEQSHSKVVRMALVAVN